jgi:hypothetical protein
MGPNDDYVVWAGRRLSALFAALAGGGCHW